MSKWLVIGFLGWVVGLAGTIVAASQNSLPLLIAALIVYVPSVCWVNWRIGNDYI